MRLITLLGACALIATISTAQAQDAIAPPSSAAAVSVAAARTGDAPQDAVAPASVPVADGALEEITVESLRKSGLDPSSYPSLSELESRVQIFNGYAVDAGGKDQQGTQEKGDKKGVTSKPKAEKEVKEKKEAKKESKDAKMEAKGPEKEAKEAKETKKEAKEAKETKKEAKEAKMEAKGAKKDGQQKEQQKGQAVKKNKNKMSGESAVRPKAQKSHDQHAKHLKGHHHHRNMQQKQQQKQQKQDNMFKAQTNGHGHHHHDKNCHHDKDEGCIVYKTITIVPTYPQTRTAPSCAQPTNELGSQVPLYLAGGDEEMDQGLEEDVSAVDEEFDDEAEAERDEGDGGIAEKLFKQQPVQDGRFEFLRRT